MNSKNFLKNEEATSVTIGFIMMATITVIVFIAIILSFYTLMQQSKNTAMRESFDILGGGLASRITTVDTLVNITSYYGGTVNSLEYEFSLPLTIANEGYSIEIANTTRQIILQSDIGAKAWIPLNASSNLMGKTIYSSAGDYKLTYNQTNNIINIEGQ
ncbi:MAG: hypothetical protein PHG00_17935 [Methylococcales bacterium]|nr:hypothetical protein [Methylococcales bacterium]MDD5473707.1 hypothetical protein [Candidatus Methanoperedens sp.]